MSMKWEVTVAIRFHGASARVHWSGLVFAGSAGRKLDPNHALRQNTVDLNCLYLHAIRSRTCSNQLISKKTAHPLKLIRFKFDLFKCRSCKWWHMKSRQITRKSGHRCASLTCISWISSIASCITCTTEISYQMISWDIIGLAGILVPQKCLTNLIREISLIIIDYLKILKRWISDWLTDWLTTWNQEMLAHLKMNLVVNLRTLWCSFYKPE